MPDPVKLLSDGEVAEIEAHLTRLTAPGEAWESKTEKADTFQNLAARHAFALCATVRALREKYDSLKSKIAWHRDGVGPDVPVLQERYDKLIVTNTALRERLAAAQSLSESTLDHNRALIAELAQVTQQRPSVNAELGDVIRTVSNVRAKDWLAIETVLKDGSEVLLTDDKDRWIDEWVVDEEWAEGGYWLMCDQWEEPKIPKRWQPLPEVPSPASPEITNRSNHEPPQH